MSTKGFQRPWINGYGAKVVTVQVMPNGASAPTLGENPDNAIASVARTGVGTLTLTLSDTFLACRAAHCDVELATPAATLVVFSGTANVSSTKVITLTTYQEAAGSFAATDIAANAGNILHVTIVLRDSGQQ